MCGHVADSPINKALRSFEAAEANLEKLERVFRELRHLIPEGICFGSNAQYEELCRTYSDILEALPAIERWKPSSYPIELNELAQWRLDAREMDEIGAIVGVEEAVDAPIRELADYRHRLNKTRRQMIRDAMAEATSQIDYILRALDKEYQDFSKTNQAINDQRFDELRRHAQEIETMLGSSLPRPQRWVDLRRHLSFGLVQDLFDIIKLDWPNVKAGLTAGLYSLNEPIPVEVPDLGALAAAHPTGTVATRLRWEALSAEEFERVLFQLLNGARGYENAEWLMRTNAPDRGRDLSVTRVTNDQLSGVIRSRIIVQCKHWASKSVAISDIAGLVEQMKLWEPPRVDVLVIATSGRFSADTVHWIETHNNADRALRIEMWPESHLERLLAERPSLIAEFRLR